MAKNLRNITQYPGKARNFDLPVFCINPRLRHYLIITLTPNRHNGYSKRKLVLKGFPKEKNLG
jgi:hypothetical protein